MLGRKQSSSPSRPKRRVFFSVRTVADAEEAVRICYQAFYALAAIQAVLIVVLSSLSSPVYENLADPIFVVVLAWFIGNKKSRIAATMIAAYSVVIILITAGNRAGIQLGTLGGRNIILAIIALFAAYKGLQGTFKYHRLIKSEIIWKHVVRMLSLFVLYSLVLIGVLFLVGLHPSLERFLSGYGEKTVSDVIGVATVCTDRVMT